MDPRTFKSMFQILRRRYPVGDWSRGRDPFDALLSIIVSQNSTDLVTARVMDDLRRRGPVTPWSVLALPPRILTATLKPAGLSRQKVPRIRSVAGLVLKRFGGNLGRIKALDTSAAREALISLPGVGPKTADVWLSMMAGRDTMPVDTHIHRLAKRWRLAPSARYEDVTAALKALIPPRDRRRGHLVLIEFGREICHARRPECDRCPVYGLCDAKEKLQPLEPTR